MLRNYIMLPLLSLLMITINFVKPKKFKLAFSKIDNMRDYSIFFFGGKKKLIILINYNLKLLYFLTIKAL